MKTYKTNQESINKGILKEMWPNYTYNKNVNNMYTLINERGYIVWNITIYKDNRIKGYCLKEVK